MLSSGKQNDIARGDERMGEPDLRKSSAPVSKRSFVLKKVNEFCDFLLTTGIKKECQNPEDNVNKFRSFSAVLGLCISWQGQFEKNSEETIRSFLESYGFLKEHFTTEEWNIIRGYITTLYKFIQKYFINELQ